jgi:polyisoprenoid-binding protein YceI
MKTSTLSHVQKNPMLSTFLLGLIAALAIAPISSHGQSTASAATPPKEEAVKAAPKLGVESGKVEFLAIGKPSFLKVKGVGTAPKGSLTMEGDKASGEFTFDLSSLDTGIALRNEHMKDKYLEVGKHPLATIRFKDVSAKEGAKQTVPAELELHGVKQPITLEATLKPDGEKKVATASFKFKLTDYQIEIPTHLGITIADEVSVTIESTLKK